MSSVTSRGAPLPCVLVGRRQDAAIIATQRTHAHRGRRGQRPATGPTGRLGAEDRAARGASRGRVSGWHGASAPTAGSRCSGGSSGHRRRGSGGAYRCVRTVQGGTQAGRLRGQHAARRSLLLDQIPTTDRSPSMAASSLTQVRRRSGTSLRTLGLQLDDTYRRNMKRYDELWSFDDEATPAQQATKDYEKLYPVIQHQFEHIGGDKCCNYKDSSDFARELDQMSLADWLDKYVRGGRASKLGQLIENALSEELAADSTALSGLWPAWQLWQEQHPPDTRVRALLPSLRRALSYPRRQRPDSAPFGRKARRRGSDGDGPDRRYQDGMERCGCR